MNILNSIIQSSLKMKIYCWKVSNPSRHINFVYFIVICIISVELVYKYLYLHGYIILEEQGILKVLKEALN